MRFVDLTLAIWDAVIERYRTEHGQDAQFEEYAGIRPVLEELLDRGEDDES